VIFRLTRRLAAKLGVEPVPSLPSAGNPLHDWTGHLFVAGRGQYIIVTNSVTLYSVVIPGGECRTAGTFVGAFTEELGGVLNRDGLGLLSSGVIPDLSKNLIFCRASDRRALGSINDFVFGAKVYIIEAGLPLPEVSRRLNQTPMKLIKYGVPCDEMSRLLGRFGEAEH
jgi:hypothetical protein